MVKHETTSSLAARHASKPASAETALSVAVGDAAVGYSSQLAAKGSWQTEVPVQ